MSTDDHFAEAAQAYAALVSQIRPEQWDGPGLGVWDLRSLVGHGARSLVTVDTYLDRPAAEVALDSAVAYIAALRGIAATVGGGPEAVAERGRQAGAALGPDPAAAIQALLERVLTRIAAVGNLLIETIGGGMRLADYLPTRTFELVVHGYDVARAVGLPPPVLSDGVLTEVVELTVGAALRHGNGPQLLLALTGREPLPESFSVV